MFLHFLAEGEKKNEKPTPCSDQNCLTCPCAKQCPPARTCHQTRAISLLQPSFQPWTLPMLAATRLPQNQAQHLASFETLARPIPLSSANRNMGTHGKRTKGIPWRRVPPLECPSNGRCNIRTHPTLQGTNFFRSEKLELRRRTKYIHKP